jgi:hypothetical protein
MTSGALMGYPHQNTAVGVTDIGFFYDGRFGNVYGLCSSPAGLRKWDAWPNGAEVRVRTLADLGGPTLNNPVCQIYRASQFVVSAGISNTAALYAFNLTDLTWNGTFGVNSSDVTNSGPYRILASSQLAAFLDLHGNDIVVATPIMSGSLTGGAELNTISWGQKTNLKFNATDYKAVLGSVPDGSGDCVWVLGWGNGYPMHLYKIHGSNQAIGGMTMTTIASVNPADIDATWTNVTTVYGVTVDQTDGNPICGFETTDAVAHQGRFVKFNAVTGAIMWNIAVAGSSGGIAYGREDMSKNVVKNGRIYYFGTDAKSLWTIDTIAGTASETILDPAAGPESINGHQMSEDVTNSILWYGGFTPNTIDPVYLGNYCGVQGIHTANHTGWRFWPNGVPSPAPSTFNQAVSTNRKRAWTFTLDGHTFYVLDLGQEGTFAWDKTTNEWAQFITKGYTAWNFCNGCMWGQRIVAGDQISTDVWEMNPGSLFDNTATVVEHVVSGGIATRNRIFHSVESFTLAASVKSLMAPGSATVTLSFSDDQGVTWQTMDTIALTGASDQEIAWTSLGSFANPGRVFKISDSGAFLRIDGADANIDNFDEQPPAGDGA